jgi:polysaccharide deacetylase family protein (PEP-CTERM system associated)
MDLVGSTAPRETAGIVHALSFDLEDWFHLVGVDACRHPASWRTFPSIVENRTYQILEILAEYDVRATFFVLGWIAEQYPELVRKIAAQGHEIGSHSYWHRRVDQMTPDEFHEDLLDSIDLLERLSGAKVRGFRAPSFSIRPGTEWAFEIMKKVGLEYDASLFPARRTHGGYRCELGPHQRHETGGEPIAELPASVFTWGPLRFCFSGGGYFRLLPGRWIARGLRQYAEAGRPAVIYLHPRDFATDCPVVRMPLHRRFKSYYGRHRTEAKLRRLLESFRFTTCRDVLVHHGLVPATPLLPSAKRSGGSPAAR